jgi:D-alanine-D-alanine ligase
VSRREKIFKNEVSDEELFSFINELKNKKRKPEKVCVIMGGESEEREISLKSGEAVFNALLKKGYDVEKVVFPIDDINYLKKFQSAFICLHGRYGEDGTVQGLLEIMKIPYTSPDPVLSAFFMDKVLVALALAKILPQPKFEIARTKEEAIEKAKNFDIPFIVKPAFSGSSLGISLVKEKKDIEKSIDESFKFSSRIIIEEFLDGPELTVGVFEKMVMGALEIIPHEDDIFSFHAKYRGKTSYIIPPKNVSDDVVEDVLSISKKICDIFEVQGAVRLDFKLKNGRPFFLELNTIPGMTERSLLPKIALYRGISFEDFVEAILLNASLKIHKK